MTPRARIVAVALMTSLWSGVAASAETLHCQSINGNLNCSGSGGVSCQTIDGRKTCVSGHGDVIQSFGGSSSGSYGPYDDDDHRGSLSGPEIRQRLEHQELMLLQQQRPRSNWNDPLSDDEDR